jgi:hypothetical protein
VQTVPWGSEDVEYVQRSSVAGGNAGGLRNRRAGNRREVGAGDHAKKRPGLTVADEEDRGWSITHTRSSCAKFDPFIQWRREEAHMAGFQVITEAK